MTSNWPSRARIKDISTDTVLPKCWDGQTGILIFPPIRQACSSHYQIVIRIPTKKCLSLLKLFSLSSFCLRGLLLELINHHQPTRIGNSCTPAAATHHHSILFDWKPSWRPWFCKQSRAPEGHLDFWLQITQCAPYCSSFIYVSEISGGILLNVTLYLF